ncbi:MAG TPA: hypothetical protein VGH87_27035 [Polyangiaceae bacterium]
MEENDFAPIQYAGFYDVPRVFLVESGQQHLLFVSHFDESIDDYEDVYTVYVMPSGFRPPPTWEALESMAERRLGTIKVSDVTFDESLRKGISIDTFRLIV